MANRKVCTLKWWPLSFCCIGTSINCTFERNQVNKKTISCLLQIILAFILLKNFTGPRKAVGNVSGDRCTSDCRCRGR